jgi:hypothetical protein
VESSLVEISVLNTLPIARVWTFFSLGTGMDGTELESPNFTPTRHYVSHSRRCS